MRLGLVCISEKLRDTKKLSAKTMTRKGFSNLPRESAIQELDRRIVHNSQVLYSTIQTLIDQGIGHYRVSSTIFPCIGDETLHLSFNDLPSISTIRANLLASGNLARQHDITLSSHPDQFNVLASYTPVVIQRSIKELNHQSDVLDMMGCTADLSSPMCLHLNKSPDLKHETVDDYRLRFLQSLSECNDGVRARLVLENEDKGFWNAERLHHWFAPHRALVFDNLHDACNPSLELENVVKRFRETWGHHTPVFHWSEGIADKPRSHADRASFVPASVAENADCTWEVELKGKDYAIEHIQQHLLVD